MATSTRKTPVLLPPQPAREKLIDRLPVPCGVLQKQRWEQAFGKQRLAGKARELLDAAADQVLPPQSPATAR